MNTIPRSAGGARSAEFNDGTYKRDLAQLILCLTNLCLDFSANVEARSSNWTSVDKIVIRCDQAVAEVMGYCFASISYLLTNEAGYSKNEVSEFISPLMVIMLVPYFQDEAGRVGVGKERLQGLFQPVEEVEDSAKMKRFKGNVRRLSAKRSSGDIDGLLVNFAKNLSLAIRELFGSRESYLQFNKKLDDSLGIFEAIFKQMDLSLEKFLVDFFEKTRG